MNVNCMMRFTIAFTDKSLIKQFVAGPSLGRSRSLHVGFVVNTRLLEQVSLQVPRFTSARMIQPMLHHVYSFIYHRPDISSATEGVVK